MSAATARESTGLHTPSLRRRVTVMSLGLLTVLLVVLAVALDVVLSSRLEAQLRDRLLDRAQVAIVLVDQVPPQDLADRLEGEGITARLTTEDGQTYVAGRVPGAVAAQPDTPAQDGPGLDGGPTVPAPVPPAGPDGPSQDDVVETGDVLSVSEVLRDGSTVELYADRGVVDDTLGQVRSAELVASVVVLAAAALLLWPVVGTGLRPLTRITDTARAISAGDRGRRLRPDRPSSDLGRTAAAFDDMLDAVEGAEGQAKASEQRLREFVSDAAHELRTPVTGVRATAEHLLREDPDRVERERLLLTLVREADRAGRLVEDLLLMARIDRGLELRLGPVDLRDLVEQCVSPRQVGHPEVTFATDVRPGLVVTGDEQRLAQVLGNLLDNALTAMGGPQATGTVRVRASEGPGEVHLDVEDEGPGVAPPDRERIFDRLTRLGEARERRRGGVGLGLPIARGIARAHGGDVVCLDSVTGRGARFRTTLPAAPQGAVVH